MKRVLLAALLTAGLAAGCSSDQNGGKDRNTPSKDDARDSQGKSDDGEDLCDLFDWYGDGVCDDFCVLPDADCDSNNGQTNNGQTNNGQTNNGQTNNGQTNNSQTNNGQTNNGGACGGHMGLTCVDGEFCDYTLEEMCGAADHLGSCRPLPQTCTEEYAPVCGCDGQTHSNACSANFAGVAVAAIGECGTTACESNDDCGAAEECVDGFCQTASGAVCGGLAGATCAPEQWCDYPDGSFCGGDDSTGTCQPRPQACLDVDDPVCGCDGMTYSNACYAQSVGVDVFETGACPNVCTTAADCGPGETCRDGVCIDATGDGGVCGGIVGLQCSADQWCDYPDDTVCGQADFQGLCKARPQACPQNYDPVCGCDAKTYSNACMAHHAGVDVAENDACSN